MDHLRFYDQALRACSRRAFLALAWRLGAAAFVLPRIEGGVLRAHRFADDPFTLGVGSGEPLPDGVVLWTRLAPRPLEGGGMPNVDAEVRWEVARDESFRTIEQRGTALARPELGHSMHVEVEGLQPGREYWYRFHAGDATSRVGRTRTAPAANAQVEQLRFAVCGCSHYEWGYFTALKHLAAEHFDLVFHTGDYIYEGRSGARKGPRAHQGDEIYTLVDYRTRYAQYKLDPDLAAAHASAPFVVSWDDHEVDNDYAGDHSEQDTPRELFLLRRAAAYQAYFENMPLRVSQLPAGPAMRLFRRLTFGRLLDLHVLDTRQYRAPQVCGGDWASDCVPAADPSRSLLGAEQERWLFENLAAPRATWTLIGQQVPMYVRDRRAFTPDARFSMDKWDGYLASRDRLFNHLAEARVPNPVVLSGDVHQHFAADLKRDFADPRSQVVGVELTNSSITSNGDGADVSPEWSTIAGDNPHIHYHSARRGYVACTAGPGTLRAEFRVVDRITTPGAPVRTGGAVIATAGQPGLQVE